MKVKAEDLRVVIPGTTVPNNEGLCVDNKNNLLWDNGRSIEPATIRSYATVAALLAAHAASPLKDGVYKVVGSDKVYVSDGVDLFLNGKRCIRNIASRLMLNQVLNATKQYALSQSNHFAADDIYTIGVVIPNWYWNTSNAAETALGASAATVKVSIEYPLPGTFGNAGSQSTYSGRSFLFSSAAAGTIPAGQSLASDLLTLATPIPRGSLFKIRIDWHNPDGVIYSDKGHSAYPSGIPNNGYVNNLRDDVFQHSTSPNVFGVAGASTYLAGDMTPFDTISGGGCIYDGIAQASGFLSPLSIFGFSTNDVPAVAITGDSIAAGWVEADTRDYLTGDVDRALGKLFATSNMAGPGDSLTKWSTGGGTKRKAVIDKYFTHVVNQLGHNDTNLVSQTITAMQQLLINHAATFNIPFIQTTLTPSTTDTVNTWTTVSDQVLTAVNTLRTHYSKWIRKGGIPGIAGCFDRAAPVECDSAGVLMQDGGYWSTSKVVSLQATYASTGSAGTMTVTSINSGPKDTIQQGNPMTQPTGSGFASRYNTVGFQATPTTQDGLGGIGTYIITNCTAPTVAVAETFYTGNLAFDGTHLTSIGSKVIAEWGAKNWPLGLLT